MKGGEIVHISTPQVSSSGLNWGGTQGGVGWQFVVVFKRPKALTKRPARYGA